jgi:hypothetical protein
MTWTWPSVGVGSLIALVVLIVAVILGFMGMVPKEVVLVIAAICSLRL